MKTRYYKTDANNPNNYSLGYLTEIGAFILRDDIHNFEHYGVKLACKIIVTAEFANQVLAAAQAARELYYELNN